MLIPTNFSAAKNPVADAWRLGMMAVELGTAAVTTIMLRNWNWVVKWPNPDRRLNAEGNRMIVVEDSGSHGGHCGMAACGFWGVVGYIQPVALRPKRC